MSNAVTGPSNQFINLRERSLNAATTLARAFCASNTPDELWACLRFQLRMDFGNPVMNYLDGSHFACVQGVNGMESVGDAMADRSSFAQEVFDEMRAKAFIFLGE